MDADAVQHRGEFVIVGEDRAAVAVAAERLGREEAGGGGMPEGADAAALVAARRTPARHRRARTDPRPPRPPRWRRGRPASPNRSTGITAFGFEAAASRGRDAALQACASMLKVVVIDIDENRRRADQRDRFARSRKT